MKEYVVIKFEVNVLVFDYKTITKEEKTLVNKNSFIEDSLLYDFKYFLFGRHFSLVFSMVTDRQPPVKATCSAGG